MTPRELKAHARRLPEELVTQGDLAVAGELFARTCRHHTPLPIAPGADGLKHCVRALWRALPDLFAVVADEIVERDRVVQRLMLSGTHRGTLFGAPASGERISWSVLTVFQFDPNGMVAEHWASWDQLDLLCQLGANSASCAGWDEG